MLTRRPSPCPAPLAGLVSTLLLLVAPLGVRAQNFVAVSDTSNPIVAATVSGAYTGAAWVDVDGDDLLDLFIARKQTMYRNLGGGAFAAMNATILNQGAALGTTWADTDNDGDLDMYLSGTVNITNGSNYYRNDGGFSFTRITTGDIGNSLFNSGWGTAFGDIDNDAFVDLVIAAANNFGGVTHVNRLLMNNGDGTFVNVDTTAVTDSLDAHTIPSWSDYDLDGDVDLFIGSGEVSQLSPDNLFRNMLVENGAWGFERITTAPIATDFVDGQVWNWIDYDNDGDLDGYLTNYNAPLPNHLYRNDGGTFVRMTEGDVGPIVGGVAAGLASVWGDLDHDGDLDCIVTNDGPAPCDVYTNDGDGTFTKVLSGDLATLPGPHYGATAGDYDRDGDLDLYVQGNTATKRLYRNDLANGNRWLVLALEGAGAPDGSNRSALGARVRMKATISGSPRWQMREVSAQNSFNSMNMLDLHFGLGGATAADSIEIAWPSGIVQVLTNVASNQRLEIQEPSGATGVTQVVAGSPGFVLGQSRPNPFASDTRIEFMLDQPAHVRLVVHDVAGRVVRTMLDEERGSGAQSAVWDGTDEGGRRVASGVYFYRMEVAGATGGTASRTMTLRR